MGKSCDVRSSEKRKNAFFLDYGTLNAMAGRDTHPFPRITDGNDLLDDEAASFTVACSSAYWQFEKPKVDRNEITFSSHPGLVRLTWMPFGLQMAPSLFQSAMHTISSRVIWQIALVYPDDIIVHLIPVTAHLGHRRTVLTLLLSTAVALKPSKYSISYSTVLNMKHTIRPGKLAVKSKNFEAICKSLPPTSPMQLKSFLRMCNVYCTSLVILLDLRPR